MKKRLVLLLILLTIQLYGCSALGAEINETIPSVSEVYSLESETLPNKETVINEVEAPVDSAFDYHTENTDSFVQDMALPTEETAVTVDDSYYSVATVLSRLDVESYATRIKQLFLEHDWSAVSSEISYPITISKITYNNSEDFLDASNSFDNSLEEAFFSALAEEDCTEMFCNWEGIMLGETGQIWIGEVLDAESTSQGLKIIAINGMLK